MTETLLVELVRFVTSEQVWIALLGVTAIALSQSTDVKKRRWACIFGLAGQPFWFYMAYKQNSWGVFILCLFYTMAWARGVFNYWVVPAINEEGRNRIKNILSFFGFNAWVEVSGDFEDHGFPGEGYLTLNNVKVDKITGYVKGSRDSYIDTDHIPVYGSTQRSNSFTAFKKDMQEDKELAFAWHDNLACCVMDTFPDSDTGENHVRANEAAKRFMRLAFDIDTSERCDKTIVQKA